MALARVGTTAFAGAARGSARLVFALVALVGLGVVGRVFGAPVASAGGGVATSDAAVARVLADAASPSDEASTRAASEPLLVVTAARDLLDGGGVTDGAAPLVDLNLADEATLQTLPGVGPRRAQSIVALRTRLGGFRRVEDLLRVRGVGRKGLARLRPLVVVRAGAPR